MKATELMIGDWVLMDMNYSEEDPMYTKTNYQPYKIQNGEDIGLACETNCIGDADVYQPIPLTPEILERNGIRYQFGMPWYQGGADGAFEFRYRSDDGSTQVQVPIRYVHELQHALRLCAIEKEIVI